MLEVLYISPSCKQAMDFIVDLANKLESTGIDGRNIDYENICLKTDKFIVSAVSICNSCLYVSREGVKYYIDMVSGENFLVPEQRDHATERLKCLRCCFREDTKEISEEELIEILKEELPHENNNS